MKKVAGFTLIGLGIVSSTIPIIPGFLLVGAGASMVSKRFDLGLKKVKRRYKCHKNPKKGAMEIGRLVLKKDMGVSNIKNPKI